MIRRASNDLSFDIYRLNFIGMHVNLGYQFYPVLVGTIYIYWALRRTEL